MTNRKRVLNARALVILGLLSVAVVVVVVISSMYQDQYGATGLLREANARLNAKPPQSHLALSYLNRYLELKPDDLNAVELKAKVLADSAQNESQIIDAIPIHTFILGREPDNPRWQPVRRRLVRLNLQVGRWKTAEVLSRDLIKRGADDAEAHRMLARALEQIGLQDDPSLLEQARREYEIAEKKEPGDVEGAERLAALYRDKLQDPAKGLQLLDNLIQLNQGSSSRLARAHLARARYLARRSDVQRSLQDYDEAVKNDPKNLEIRLEAALTLANRGDTIAARRHLEAVPAESRNDLRVRLVEGHIDLAEQKPSEAIQTWRQGLLGTGGTNAELTGQLAQLLLELGRVREAEPLIAQYQRLVGGESANPRYHYLHGYLLMRTSQFREAIRELEGVRYTVDKSLEPHLYFILGQAYEATKDELKALEAYRKASELSQLWSTPWLAIARLHASSDRPREAIRTLQTALGTVPNDPQLHVSLAQTLLQEQLRLSASERSWDQLDRVLEDARKAVPQLPEFVLVQADYFLAQNRIDDAVGLLQEAAQLHPRSVPIWLALVNVLNRAGRTSEALSVVDQALAATGPQAGLIVSRAAILIAQSHVKQAHAALLEGLKRVSADQKFMLWRELGKLLAQQNNLSAARRAFEEWAKLQPEIPDPRIALLTLALASGDDKVIHDAVESLKPFGGPKSPFWRVARVEELLRSKAAGATSQPSQKERLDEAEKLIKEIEADNPKLPQALVLEARLMEQRNQIDKAIQAYQRAIDLKGGPIALIPLVTLLVREHRDTELQALRAKVTMPSDIERLAAGEAWKLGDKDRAAQFAAQLVQENPQGRDARLLQVQVLRGQGKIKEAEEALKLLAEQQPERLDTWLLLLALQASQNETQEVDRTIERIRARVRSDRPDLVMAYCYRVAGDLVRANASYRAALKAWPQDPEVQKAAIDFFEQIDNRREAEELLRELLQKDPALDWATRKLALSLSSHPNDRAAWDEAIRLIGPADRPDDALEDRLTRAQVYARGPNPDDRQRALKMLEELAKEEPQVAAIQELMARILLVSNQLPQAHEHAALAARSESATADAIEVYLEILIREKNFEEAQHQWERLAALVPNDFRVIELRARLLAAQGKDQEATAVLEQALAKRAGAPDVLIVGGSIIGLLAELNQLDVAERIAIDLTKQVKGAVLLLAQFISAHRKPEYATTLIEKLGSEAATSQAAGSLALALMGSGSRRGDPHWIDETDRALTAALKKNPETAELLQAQALLRHLQGRYEDEVGLYQALLNRQPDDVKLLNNMAWILSEELGRSQEGLERVNQALKQAGNDPHYLDTRGVILTRLGRYDEAIGDLTSAASGLGSGPIYFHLARAHQKKGNLPEARKYRDRAQQAGLKSADLQRSEQVDWEKLGK